MGHEVLCLREAYIDVQAGRLTAKGVDTGRICRRSLEAAWMRRERRPRISERLRALKQPAQRVPLPHLGLAGHMCPRRRQGRKVLEPDVQATAPSWDPLGLENLEPCACSDGVRF